MILLTGSEGLIGRHVRQGLEASGLQVKRFDVARSPMEDIRDPAALRAALDGVTGVLHLAAVSRIELAEANPAACEATNVEAFGQLLRLCLDRPDPPWVIFASSREVYGRRSAMPVAESAELAPVNVYARSKVEGERLTAMAAEAGLHTNICRLSNVFGCPHDHPDRVAVAFATAAARGGLIRVDGAQCQFDFTVISDVAEGLCRLIQATMAGERFPPVQFVTGRGTTLGELAALAAGMAIRPVRIVEAPARTFDVPRFVGNPARAETLLGWRATTDVAAGLANLLDALREATPVVSSAR